MNSGRPSKVARSRSGRDREPLRVLAQDRGNRLPKAVLQGEDAWSIFVGSGHVRYVSMIEGDGHDARARRDRRVRGRASAETSGVFAGVQAQAGCDGDGAGRVGFADCAAARVEHEPVVHVAAAEGIRADHATDDGAEAVAGGDCGTGAGAASWRGIRQGRFVHRFVVGR